MTISGEDRVLLEQLEQWALEEGVILVQRIEEYWKDGVHY